MRGELARDWGYEAERLQVALLEVAGAVHLDRADLDRWVELRKTKS